MADHPLIDGYLSRLDGQLPVDTVAELADGLAETYERHRTEGLDPDTAASAAIAEFGAADAVLSAFVRQAPGRRAALLLLALGPAVGVCWVFALVTGHAWDWPVPGWLRLAFGLTLLAAIVAIALAATARTSYHRTRAGGPACLAIMLLDASVLTTVAFIAPSVGWPLALAIPASLARIAMTARLLPRLFT